MRRFYLRFLRGASADLFSALGVALVTSIVIIFFVFEFLSLAGIITQAYVGLITYLAFPALFILGLLMILSAGCSGVGAQEDQSNTCCQIDLMKMICAKLPPAPVSRVWY
jgi:hypothetical protein